MVDLYIGGIVKETALLFDLDETLIRCNEYYVDTKRKFATMACQRTGISQDIALSILKTIDAESIKIDGFGKSRFPKSFSAASVAIDVLMGRTPSTTHAKKAWSLGNSVFTAKYPLYPGAWDALTKIKELGYNMFLCTKGDPRVQMKKIIKNKLNKIFPDGHIYIDVFKNETHFSKILKEHHLNKSKTIVIGDNLIDDIKSAEKLKLRSILVSNEQTNNEIGEEEKNKSTWQIENIADLPKLLDDLHLD